MHDSLSQHQIIDAFRQAMRDAGIPYSGEIITDNGKINRFRVDGDKRGSLNGFYTLFTDGLPAGCFGSWKLGINEPWCAKYASTMTAEDRQAFQNRIEQMRAQREADEKARHDAASARANEIWNLAQPANDNHPYLVRKGVKAHGLRVGRWTRTDEESGRVWLDVPDALLVPIKRGKVIMSLQAILPNGDNAIHRDKDFLPGGAKYGLFFGIGHPGEKDTTDTIVICEGYATGASIYEATGFTVCVAFDASNLVAVAAKVRELRPMARLIIAADNDQWTTEPVQNPGVHFAKIAADRCRAYVAVPDFPDLSAKPTDFNDLAKLNGVEAVKQQIIEASTPPPPPPVIESAESTELAIAEGWVPSQESVDYQTPLPESNSKGTPISTIENFRAMLDRLGVTIRYNVISKEEEILIPGQAFSIDNQANASMAWIMSWCNRFKMPTGNVADYITYMADHNMYNPVHRWITSKAWDGRNRIPNLMDTIKAVGEAEDSLVRTNKEIMIIRWLVSAVAAACSPNGIASKGVLVLQGDQNVGKTSWFKSLVPAHLGLIQDGLLLRPDDRDSVKQVVSFWMVELGELDATFRKSDIAQLKSFLSRDKDILRRAYARRESTFARRTVFFASVNPREFLHDPTGNIRYWTIACESINHRHGIDMQQVWAQVYETAYLTWDAKGRPDPAPWYLTPDEVNSLNEANKAFEVIDPIQERIANGIMWDQPPGAWRWATATEVMLELGFVNPSQAEATRAAHIIRNMNGNRNRRTKTRRELLVPFRKYAGNH